MRIGFIGNSVTCTSETHKIINTESWARASIYKLWGGARSVHNTSVYRHLEVFDLPCAEKLSHSSMIAVLILTVVVVATQATPVVYRPAVYSRPATVYVQPAPITYTAPVVVKEAPKPYSFGYEAPAIGGGSSRHETSDGNGRVTGSYTVADADGRLRVVDYYADETGFHANVKTNEPGTANQDSADVSVQSYAAPVSSPVVAPKIVAAPAPVYTVAPVRTVARRVVAPVPVSYGVLPDYNSLSYATPVTTYSNGYYGNAAPYYGSYVPKSDYYYYK